MKRIVRPLVLAALFGTSFLAQAEGIGFYVTPRIGLGWFQGYDAKYEGVESDAFKMSSDTPPVGAIAVGYGFNKFRAELEYALSGKANNEYKKRHEDDDRWRDVNMRSFLGIKTLFLNGYYDFRNSSAFTPYVGTGLGASFVDMKVTGQAQWSDGDTYSASFGKKSTANFAWNFGVGFNYAFTKQIGLDLGYRFVWVASKGRTKKTHNDDAYSDYDEHRYDWNYDEYGKTKDLYMHQVMLGVRYSF